MSALKLLRKNAAGKSSMLKRKRPASEISSTSDEESGDEDINLSKNENGTSVKTSKKWKNRERVLVFCSRDTSYRIRHLMNDLRNLMPHAKSDQKMDKRKSIVLINEIAEIENCTKCIYFETRKHMDVYLWVSNISSGPSVKFLLHNVHTMDELKMSGNCLRASRPILSFDSAFDAQPHLALIKELLMQTFGTPNYHPRSQPFFDHVFTFSLTSDGKIWFRNFQIVEETFDLQEIGPRMVLEIIRIFQKSFEGAVLYDNPNYVSPNTARSELKKKAGNKYLERKMHDKSRMIRDAEISKVAIKDPVGEEFNTETEVVSAVAKKIKRTIEKKRSRKKSSGKTSKN